MFPRSFFPPSYFPNQYWQKNGEAAVVKRGAGGQIVAERYRRLYLAMMRETEQRSILQELTKMRAREGKRTVEVLNHLQIRAEEANHKAMQRAAIYCALMAEA